jgi:hypothetical protein
MFLLPIDNLPIYAYYCGSKKLMPVLTPFQHVDATDRHDP